MKRRKTVKINRSPAPGKGRERERTSERFYVRRIDSASLKPSVHTITQTDLEKESPKNREVKEIPLS